jgi:hypothetical protein
VWQIQCPWRLIYPRVYSSEGRGWQSYVTNVSAGSEHKYAPSVSYFKIPLLIITDNLRLQFQHVVPGIVGLLGGAQRWGF